METSKILVADDDPSWVDLTRLWLEAAGYRVIATSDESAILELALRHLPDCVVLDYRMTRSSAEHLCRQLRSHAGIRAVPIIVQSAHKDKKLDSLYAGADQYVVKDGGQDELLAAVHACLRRTNLDAGILEKGDLCLDPAGFIVSWRRKPIGTLSPEQFRFLYAIVEHSPNPIPRQKLSRIVLHDPRVREESKALDELAYRVKIKLGKTLRRRIGSSKRLGWFYVPEGVRAEN